MTLLILVVTGIVSFIAFQNRSIFDRFIFNPFIIAQRREWYRFISSGFIHADGFHLIVNMLVFYSFGQFVEYYYAQEFGSKATINFLLLYFGGLIMSVVPTYAKRKHDPAYNALGASGAVSAVVFSSILFSPMQKIYLFGIIGMPGIIFGIAYLVYCYYMGKKGADNINHDAHMWGALFGFVFTILLKPSILSSFIDQLIYFRDAI